jgi:hypothetical protein
LIPPKDSKYLYPISDYDVFEFRSPVNPWKVQSEYQDDFDKIKTLEVELFQGMIMYIPAYWWYSVQFVVPETSVCSFKYRTHMNSISILPRTMMNVLQNLNIKRDTLEKRAYIPDQFKSTLSTVAPDTNQGSSSGRSSRIISKKEEPSSTSSTAPPINPQHYDNQYLPSSLRNNNNPFSVNTIVPVPEVDKQVISSVLGEPISDSTSADVIAAAPSSDSTGRELTSTVPS